MIEVPVGARLAGRYVIQATLGAGGMGVVARARDERLGRDVAVKLLPATSLGDAAARARMIREARAAATLSHPGIVQIFDVDETPDGGAYLVMELVRGRSLRARLGEGALPRGEAVRIVEETAAALGAAHRAGFVHRDVKPDNVMIREDGRVVVLDFGLAKEVDEDPAHVTQITATGAIVGTPAYLAPEQARNVGVGPATDQFALGVLAYELLAGRLPWRGTTPTAVLAEILTEDPPPPSAVSPGIRPEVDRAVLRALSRDATARFPTVVDFAAALRAAVGGDAAILGTAVGEVVVATPAATTPPVASPAAAALPTPAPVAAAAAPRRGVAGRRAWVAAVVLAAAAALGAWLWPERSDERVVPTGTPPQPAVSRASPIAFDEQPLTANPIENPIFGFGAAADGTVFSQDSEGLWLRPLDGPPRAIEVPEALRTARLLSVDASGRLFALRGGGRWCTAELRGSRLEPRRDFAGAMGISAVFSPDGRELALATSEGIRIADLERPDAPLRELVDPGTGLNGQLDWSPDGRWLVYLRASPGRQPLSLHVISRDGTRDATILGDVRLNIWGRVAVAFSQTGSVVYALAPPVGRSGGIELWEQPLEDGRPAGPPQRLHVWSDRLPERLVRTRRGFVVSMVEMQDDVYVGELGAGGSSLTGLRRLTLDDRSDRPTSWSPALGVLFSSNRRGPWQAFAQAPDAQRAQQLAPSALWQTYPEAIGDTGVLWFESDVAPDGSVRATRVVRHEGGEPRVLAEVEGDAHAFTAGRPPPTRIALRCLPTRCFLFTSRGDDWRVELLDPSSGARTPLPRLVVRSYGRPSISPDGALVAGAFEGSLTIATMDGSSLRAFDLQARPGEIAHEVLWTPDGAHLLVPLGNDSNEARVVSVDARSGEVVTLLARASSWLTHLAVSPDGRQLAALVRERDYDLWSLTPTEVR